MKLHSRFLRSQDSSPKESPSSPPPPPREVDSVDSDFAIILAALLCALICVLGLVAVARCAWIRRFASGNFAPPTSAGNKGLKKKVLGSLPKLTFKPEDSTRFSECAICLMDFADGDQVRVLPQCGHAFHVLCVDKWLGSHSSCPSCRQILVFARCRRCGELPAATPAGTSAAGPDTEAALKQREDHHHHHVCTFLP